MDEVGYDAGRAEVRHWMTEIFKTHDRYTAVEMYQERMKDRAGVRGLLTFDSGFFASADKVLRCDSGLGLHASVGWVAHPCAPRRGGELSDAIRGADCD